MSNNTSELDLGQPATVLWVPEDQIPATQSFASLRDAVLFVMSELAPRYRAIASITAERGVLTAGEIEDVFGRLTSE